MWGPRAVCRWTWSPWCSPSWPSGGLIYGLSSIGQILAGGSAAVVALSVTGVGAVALVLFALRQIRRARTGEVLSAFLTSAGLVGIALMLSLFIRAPRSGSRTEIEG